MKHRKLFPASNTNQSFVCPDVCDATCPYYCFPYTDTYSLPPPLPPPSQPPPPPPSSPHNLNISPYIIIAATFLGITFLFISYYLVIVRNCFRLRRADQENSDDDDSIDETRVPAIDHPIWYIRTIGLQPSIINSITVFNYKKGGESLTEGTDCTICLSEFQDDEILRLLPKCNHAFHIPCIDTWLRSHTNCPVCRAGIVSANNYAAAPVARTERTQVEISSSSADEGLNRSNQASENGESDQGMSPDTQREREDTDPQADTIKTEVNKGIAEAACSSSSSCLADDSDARGSIEGDQKHVKRSVSADSLAISKIKQAMFSLLVNGEYQESPVNQSSDAFRIRSQRENGIHARMPQTSNGVRVKRSFSSGGRSFLSRHPQSSSSVLPL